MELRDAKNDVNVLGGWLPDMVRGKFGVKPATILGLVSDYDGAHSRNWDEVGCAADMIALVHGNPTSHPVEKILGFLDWTLSQRDYMRGEGSILTKVYTRHIWIPKLIQWAACRVLASRGDARFAPYANRLYLWLRAGLGFGIICAIHVRMRGLRDAVTKSAPRPGVIVADGPVPKQYPALSSVPCGRRGWDGDFPAGRGWFWGNILHVISYYIAEFGLGKPSRTEDAGLAIRQAWKIDTTLTTQPERDRIDRAIGGSVPDLDWVVSELIGWYVSNDPVEVYRFDGGVISVNLKSGGGPTNTLVAFAQLKSGVAMAMAPTSGHRGGSTDSHSAVVDLAARKVTATAGGGNVETMDMPPGAIQWAYGWPGDAQPGKRIFPQGAPQPEPGPAPAPSPAPEPKKKSKNWFEKLIEWFKDLF